MARKPNYDYEKRKKEIDRKAKKEAKAEAKLQQKRDNANRESTGEEEQQPAE